MVALTIRITTALALGALAAGCNGGASPASTGGGGTSGGPQDAGGNIADVRQPASTGRYVPLAVGARWSWNGFDTLTGARGVVDSRVEALDSMTGAKAGIRAFRVRNTTLGGSTVNWQQDTGTAIVRHREQFFDAAGTLTSDHLFTPGKLRLDEAGAHVAAAASWSETYTDAVTAALTPPTTPSTTVAATWSVEAVAETVTVPAGTFTCLRVHRVEPGFDSTFWFARDIGKVKEDGTEQRELIGYFIP